VTPYRGGCLCGSVRYAITELLVHTFYCHCTDPLIWAAEAKLGAASRAEAVSIALRTGLLPV
jgi:hypothetical protein